MKRILSAFGLFLITVGAVRVTAQVNPYKDGTPGVTGFVGAGAKPVPLARRMMGFSDSSRR